MMTIMVVDEKLCDAPVATTLYTYPARCTLPPICVPLPICLPLRAADAPPSPRLNRAVQPLTDRQEAFEQ